MSERETTQPPDATGPSAETLKQMNDENMKLQKQVAVLQAQQEVYNQQLREKMNDMRPEVSNLIQSIYQDTENKEYKTELAPMVAWSDAMDTSGSDSLQTSESPRLRACTPGHCSPP